MLCTFINYTKKEWNCLYGTSSNSELEICELKNEIQKIFALDRKIPMSESNIGRILENIID